MKKRRWIVVGVIGLLVALLGLCIFSRDDERTTGWAKEGDMWYHQIPRGGICTATIGRESVGLTVILGDPEGEAIIFEGGVATEVLNVFAPRGSFLHHCAAVMCTLQFQEELSPDELAFLKRHVPAKFRCGGLQV